MYPAEMPKILERTSPLDAMTKGPNKAVLVPAKIRARISRPWVSVPSQWLPLAGFATDVRSWTVAEPARL
jgi:hypothetical protein